MILSKTISSSISVSTSIALTMSIGSDRLSGFAWISGEMVGEQLKHKR